MTDNIPLDLDDDIFKFDDTAADIEMDPELAELLKSLDAVRQFLVLFSYVSKKGSDKEDKKEDKDDSSEAASDDEDNSKAPPENPKILVI